MKHILFAAGVILSLLLAACENNQGKELSEYPEATTGDSLLYYYMQMRAYEYWNDAQTDTTLKNLVQREKFLKGVEKGLSMVGKDPLYNKGMRLGMRLGVRLREFEQKYDVDLNNEIIINSLRNGLRDGNENMSLESQKEFYRLLDKMKSELKFKEENAAQAALVKIAKAEGLSKLNEKLYYKMVRPGTGPMVADGDVIEVAVDYTRSDGDNIGLPSPVTVTVGQSGVPQVMDQAYHRLNHGAIARFATTARMLFGSRTAMMGLEDSDVVIMEMILNKIITPTDENHPGSAVVPRQ